MRLPTVVFVLTALIQAGWACRWDSDTLAFEAKQLPDVVQTIAGRFDRNPPLYYQMRLARVEKEVVANPQKLELYDDAAVACDVLGRGDDAIRWMERKRKVLDKMPASEAKTDHEYRYFANLGTIVAHRWFAQGAKEERIKEIEHAENLINKAITINPNAHFGREIVQAKILHWVANHNGERLALSDFGQLPTKSVQKGLCGLIVLGNAWESIDIFNVLAEACDDDGSFGGDYGLATISGLAHMRVKELFDAGKQSLVQDGMVTRLKDDPLGLDMLTWQKEDVRKNFAKLRENGEAYHAHRTEFMVAKLKQGLHPDTDPNFWQGYEPVPPYTIPTAQIPFSTWVISKGAIILPLLCLFFAVGIPAIFFIVRAKIRRRRAVATP